MSQPNLTAPVRKRSASRVPNVANASRPARQQYNGARKGAAAARQAVWRGSSAGAAAARQAAEWAVDAAGVRAACCRVQPAVRGGGQQAAGSAARGQARVLPAGARAARRGSAAVVARQRVAQRVRVRARRYAQCALLVMARVRRSVCSAPRAQQAGRGQRSAQRVMYAFCLHPLCVQT